MDGLTKGCLIDRDKEASVRVKQVCDFYLPVAKHLRLRLAAKATA